MSTNVQDLLPDEMELNKQSCFRKITRSTFRLRKVILPFCKPHTLYTITTMREIIVSKCLTVKEPETRLRRSLNANRVELYFLDMKEV
jgi:hypothetical protein